MSKCETCEGWGPFQCSYCKGYFCNEHLPPHKHYCTSVSKEDIISKVIDKATLSETLLDSSLFIATMFIYAFIMGVIVLAVDAVVLLLLNLWNAYTWLSLLWVEGFIMAFVGGTAGLYHRKAPVPWATPMGTHLHRIKWAVRYPLFWTSFGIAGLMLILVGFLIWQSR
jgi:hypothetical protein